MIAKLHNQIYGIEYAIVATLINCQTQDNDIRVVE
jgi:hypothetical protein